ncbi:protein FEZ-like isoform X1 [Gossypium australe]|uniref:Protein FEZ-like isoform X1 n=1 Tax=Gossypium australe TaxID=47621 RepID=A0A5B6U934_9ROSI|nr:protein FEZ-like isoform X1 [Gossypium australe]
MVLIQNYEDLHWSFLHQISKNRVKEDEVKNPVKEDRHKWDYLIPASENRVEEEDRVEEDYSIPVLKNPVEEDREEDHYELDNPIPVGFQFLPTNEELITEYLINKILHNPLPFWDFSEVEEAVLYSTHPKSLVDFVNGEQKWYFYIHKDKNFSNNTIRKVGDDLGFWSLKWYEKIHDAKGNKVAFNNHFVFFSKRRKKTHWKMDELQLHYYYDWHNQPPVGFRFLRTPEELVKQYLVKKVLGNPLPVSDFLEVEEAEFYTTPPMSSAVHFCSGEREWYFFIHKDNNIPNNPIWDVGNNAGSWKLRKTRQIFDTMGNKIAFKFYFVYYSKLGKTHWKMDEFRLPAEFYKDFKVKDEWAMGRLRRGREYF